MTVPATDPFADSGAPAVSFKDAQVGTAYTLQVLEAPVLVQGRDFDTGKLATWPDGNPKMTVVTRVKANGEERGLWAAKPSALFAAMSEAQKAAGRPIAPGGTLTVTYTGDKPNATNPRLNPAKQYRVTYTPPNALADANAGRPQTGIGNSSDAQPPF